MPTKKWVKGQPNPNPNGRPKSVFNFKKELEGKLSEVKPDDKDKRTYGRIMIDCAIDAAIGANNGGSPSIRALSEVLDRLLGKPAQTIANIDLRPEDREAAIASILDSLEEFAKLEHADDGDKSATVQ